MKLKWILPEEFGMQVVYRRDLWHMHLQGFRTAIIVAKSIVEIMQCRQLQDSWIYWNHTPSLWFSWQRRIDKWRLVWPPFRTFRGSLEGGNVSLFRRMDLTIFIDSELNTLFLKIDAIVIRIICFSLSLLTRRFLPTESMDLAYRNEQGCARC